VLRFAVSAETYATFREAVGHLQRESESRFEDDELLLLIARKLLGGPVDEGRSSYQIAVTTCAKCTRAWQEAQGELVAIDEVVREKAACDAQHIGCIDPSRSIEPTAATDPTTGTDQAAAGEPQHRASQSIPPGTRRQV